MPKRGPGFISRHEDGVLCSNPRFPFTAVPKIFVTSFLAPGRGLEAGTVHELASWQLLWPCGEEATQMHGLDAMGLVR